jgi:hypothetical protein
MQCSDHLHTNNARPMSRMWMGAQGSSDHLYIFCLFWKTEYSTIYWYKTEFSVSLLRTFCLIAILFKKYSDMQFWGNVAMICSVMEFWEGNKLCDKAVSFMDESVLIHAVFLFQECHLNRVTSHNLLGLQFFPHRIIIRRFIQVVEYISVVHCFFFTSFSFIS